MASTIPGGFPSDPIEPPNSSNRAIFNSHNIKRVFSNALFWVQLVLIKPIIFAVVVLFRFISLIVSLTYKISFQVSARQAYNPTDKALQFIANLEENLTPEELRDHHENGGKLPRFYEGGYSQALYMANSRAKFLFVYLTNNKNENSFNMFKQIITNPEFISLCNNDNSIVWGGDVFYPEAYQLANSLGVTKFPFVGLLCLTRNTVMTAEGSVKTPPKISLISKIQGSISSDTDPTDLIEMKFVRRINKYGTELALIREELRKKHMNKLLVKQQEMNYQSSLARDRKKKEQMLLKKNRELYMTSRIPYFKNLLNNPVSEDVATIVIKRPNGERKTVKFPADSPLLDVFEFAELFSSDKLDFNQDQEQTTSNDISRFNPGFDFKLISPLPPKIVLNDHLNSNSVTEPQIKDFPCIYPRGLIIMDV